jgi:hypothetical protein
MAEPAASRPFPWRVLLLVLVAFVVTRGAMAYVVEHPDSYATDHHQVSDASFDRGNYGIWSQRYWDSGELPYRDYDLEYPPGAFGAALVPDLLLGQHFDYGFRYVLFAIGVDAVGLIAVWRLARRTGSWWGVAAWLALVPLVGPVAYSRLDIVVAAALAWTFERAMAGRWATSGAALGLGVVSKIIPALLVPAVVIVSPERRRLILGGAVVGGLALLPFAGHLGTLYDDVIRYHQDRPVHAESLWASLAFLGDRFDLTKTGIEFSFGAFNVTGTWANTFRRLADVAALGVLVDSVLQARLRVRRGDVTHLIVLSVATLTLLTAVGRVLSPQYLVWLVAIQAVGLCVAPRALAGSAAWLALAALLTQLEYPVFFFDLMARHVEAEVLLLARNLALVVSGLLAARASWRYRSVAPVGEGGQEVEALLGDGREGPERDVGDEGQDRGQHDPARHQA